MSGEYPNYEEIFKDLMTKGCKIILAHPERYIAFQKNYDYIYDLEKRLNKVLKEYDVDLENITLYKPVPSEEVPFGYKGRTVIMEQLIVDEEIQAFIRGDVKDVNTSAIEAVAKKNGMLTLEQKGLISVLRGETTLEEVSRVI